MKGKRKFGKAILAFAAGVTLISLVVGCSVIRDLTSRPYLFYSRPDSPGTTDSLTRTFFSNVRLGKHNVEAIYGFACYLQQRGKHQLALNEFQKIVAIDPYHVNAYNGLGVSHDMLGQYDLAIPCYQRALELDPNLDYVHNNLGYSYLLQGDTRAATEAFQKAIALNEGDKRYQNNLRLAYVRDSQSRQSAPQTQMSSADRPEHTSDAAFQTEGTEIWMPRASAHVSHTAPSREASSETPEMEAAVSHLQLEISNGNGVNRMARMVGEYLIQKGLHRPRLTNAEHFNHEKTVIYYREGSLGMASDVAFHLPGWQDVERVDRFDRPGTRVRVLLGKDLVPYRTSFAGEGGSPKKTS